MDHHEPMELENPVLMRSTEVAEENHRQLSRRRVEEFIDENCIQPQRKVRKTVRLNDIFQILNISGKHRFVHRACINSLPDDVIQNIFHYLMKQNTRTSPAGISHELHSNISCGLPLALTSRRMRDLFYSSLYFINVSDRSDANFSNTSDEHLSHFFVVIGKQIRRLHLGPLQFMGAQTLTSVSMNCINMTSLEVNITHPVPPEEAWQLLFERGPKLKRLNITLFPMFNNGQNSDLSYAILTGIEQFCTHLEHLVLGRLHNLPVDSLVYFMNGLQNHQIRSLALLLTHEDSLSARELYSIGTEFHQLTHLYLSCGIACKEWEILASIMRLRFTLRCIHLYGSGVLHPDTMRIILEECIFLREFRFIRASIARLPETFFGMLPEEKKPDFVVIGMDGFGDNLCRIVQERGFTNLNKVIVSRGSMTDVGLESLVSKSKTTLKRLRIAACPVTGQCLQFLGSQLKNLEELSLEENDIIKDSDIRQFLEQAKGLKKLTLLKLRKITRRTLRAFCDKSISLRDVSMDAKFYHRVREARCLYPELRYLNFRFISEHPIRNEATFLEEYFTQNIILLPNNLNPLQEIGQPPWRGELIRNGYPETLVKRPWLIEEKDFELIGLTDDKQ